MDFDTQGYTFVGTPHTRNILRTQGLAGFSLDDPTKTPCFQAQVGTGQGDVSSPFNWNSFFDILLRALDTVKTTPLYIRSEEHILQPTEDSGFADLGQCTQRRSPRKGRCRLCLQHRLQSGYSCQQITSSADTLGYGRPPRIPRRRHHSTL